MLNGSYGSIRGAMQEAQSWKEEARRWEHESRM
jgi:hypothetical protein